MPYMKRIVSNLSGKYRTILNSNISWSLSTWCAIIYLGVVTHRLTEETKENTKTHICIVLFDIFHPIQKLIWNVMRCCRNVKKKTFINRYMYNGEGKSAFFGFYTIFLVKSMYRAKISFSYLSNYVKVYLVLNWYEPTVEKLVVMYVYHV